MKNQTVMNGVLSAAAADTLPFDLGTEVELAEVAEATSVVKGETKMAKTIAEVKMDKVIAAAEELKGTTVLNKDSINKCLKVFREVADLLLYEQTQAKEGERYPVTVTAVAKKAYALKVIPGFFVDTLSPVCVFGIQPYQHIMINGAKMFASMERDVKIEDGKIYLNYGFIKKKKSNPKEGEVPHYWIKDYLFESAMAVQAKRAKKAEKQTIDAQSVVDDINDIDDTEVG